MLNILLADDDKDDCFFFKKALEELLFPTHLDIVRDGEKLMKYLFENCSRLPDVLFLDLNMPRKNGAECLVEIKSDKRLKDIPIIIYSTSFNETAADYYYKTGAHYYLRKCDYFELKKILHQVLRILLKEKIQRPARNEFVFGMVERA